MENLNEDVLLKVRSSRACIGAGYRLFTGNFKKIFRYSWLAALVYGLCNGIYTSYMVTEYPKMLLAATTGQLFAPGLIVPVLVTTLVPLLMFVASIWLCAHVFTLLTQHRSEGIITIPPKRFTVCTDKHSILRTTAWAILCLVFAFIAWVVVGGIIFYAVAGKSMTFMGLGALVGLAIALLMLPLAYPAMHYLTTRGIRLFNRTSCSAVSGLSSPQKAERPSFRSCTA